MNPINNIDRYALYVTITHLLLIDMHNNFTLKNIYSSSSFSIFFFGRKNIYSLQKWGSNKPSLDTSGDKGLKLWFPAVKFGPIYTCLYFRLKGRSVTAVKVTPQHCRCLVTHASGIHVLVLCSPVYDSLLPLPTGFGCTKKNNSLLPF